ncbi:hypothetical protein [Janthinobacterium sp.]|uniref:hypothetical protein n=1 Tax=Janthinobacterium sp. TaxID=1871054 RepID=UPI00260CFB67|nr:hypothetical protein [Janthinobacterium sp.]
MVNITATSAGLAQQSKVSAADNLAPKTTPAQASAGAGGASDTTVISTLASRLSRAESSTSANIQGLDHQALAARLNANIRDINYPLDAAHKEAAAQQAPQPNDAASARSAAAATAFIDGRGANPFAGLSREQLAAITHDDSGTFTINERRAAYTQAYDEEQAWRTQVVAQAMHEYDTTGKMTDFFKSVLSHFEGLPKLEQALYPEDYASDLQDKIKLDFNYFNHAAGDGGPTPGSLASMSKGELANKAPDLFDLLLGLGSASGARQ